MAAILIAAPVPAGSNALDWIRRNPTIVIGSAILGLFVAVALLAPWIAGDPLSFDRVSATARL